MTVSRANDLRVLLLPPTRRDGEAIKKLLSGTDVACTVCHSMPELCWEMQNGVGSVLVSEEALTGDPDPLIHSIRTQPVWSDIASIVLSRSGAEQPKLTAVIPYLGNVSVVERPVRVNTLLAMVRSSLRARERQYEVREHIAQQEETQFELKASEQRLHMAVQTGRLGVWELDTSTRSLSCSEGCLANYGRQPGDSFTYEDLWNAMHAEDVERVSATLQRAIRESAEFDLEYRTIWPDGSTHWMLVRGRPSLDPSRSPEHIAGVTLDITDRKFAEEQRASLLEAERAARSEAERAGRMKDEFLATLSHELRTPLNAILGWSQVLLLQPPAPKELQDGLLTIERNARAQTQIIEDLLDMSRIISGKVLLEMQRIPMSTIVDASIATIKPAAEAKGVHLDATCDQDLEIRGDAARLQQVLWNLLNNAVKFTPQGRRVALHVSRVDDRVEIRVQDTGDGIDTDFLPHIFDRFRQADASTTRKHGGLGLGLAIVKQLVELHGGTIRAESEGKGCGAEFIVMLPLAAAEAERDHDVAPLSSRIPSKSRRQDWRDNLSGLKIVAVDDEPDALALLKRLLEDCMATVFLASSAEEAFKLVQSVQPDVLISDIGMPGEDGLALIQRVRALDAELGGNTPALALTAYARVEDRANTARAGFQHHIAKPVDPPELIAAVARLARTSRLSGQPT